jgi:oxygen-dependent protoporphyrinogen oxidase
VARADAVTTVGVVGGGLAGLTAARDQRHAGFDVALFEAAPRTGGVVVSERLPDGSLVEGGPDGFLAADADVPALAADLGIAARVVGQAARGSLVWDGTALTSLEEGAAATLLGIQVRPEDLAAGHASFADGMGELTAALARGVDGGVRLGLAVIGIAPAPGGVRLAAADGTALNAAAAVLAVPAYRASVLARGLSPAAADRLREVRYAPSLTVTLGYAVTQLRRPLEGTGFVVAEETTTPLRACTYASRKFPGRAAPGRVVLRAFLRAGAAPPARVAHEALAAILDIGGEPAWQRTYDWPRGLPIYDEHHAARVGAVRRAFAPVAPVWLAGAAFDGPGVSACVRSGRAAARDVARAVRAQISK